VKNEDETEDKNDLILNALKKKAKDNKKKGADLD